jgi:hypothetical protein
MNPIRKHTSDLFASRGCDIDSAMEQAKQIIEALPSDNRAPAYTALMVVINTAANAFDQSRGPSPERLALIELIDQRISEYKLVREDAVNQMIESWMESNVDHDDLISEWMGNNFDITDYDDNIDWDSQLGDRISDGITDWMSDNLSDKISDLDLVVRTR